MLTLKTGTNFGTPSHLEDSTRFGLYSTRYRIHAAFKHFHLGEWIEVFADSVAGLWTERESEETSAVSNVPRYAGSQLLLWTSVSVPTRTRDKCAGQQHVTGKHVLLVIKAFSHTWRSDA